MKCIYLLTSNTYTIAHPPIELVQSERLKPWTIHFDGVAYEFRLFDRLGKTASHDAAFLFVETRLDDIAARELVNSYLERNVHIQFVAAPTPAQS